MIELMFATSFVKHGMGCFVFFVEMKRASTLHFTGVSAQILL
jgi:hypothetical protein